MSIEEKILEVLGEGKPLKGREIAAILSSKYGLNVDKTEVNKLLYHKLRSQAEQNKNYQWSLKKNGNATAKKTLPSNTLGSTPLTKLAYYYLECLSKDMDGGISVFTSNNYNPDYTELSKVPLDGNSTERISDNLVEKVRRDKNNFVFKLGYPILIKSIVSRKNGVTYTFAEPLFIFSVDTEYALQNKTSKLTEDDPVLNSKALASITGIASSSELLLEIIELYEELGLNNDPEDKPSIEDLVLRLEQIRSDWKWKESVDVNELSSQNIPSISIDGIYNKAAVFIGEKSKYTVGLEKDLKDLSRLPESNYRNSSLGSWINNSIGATSISDKVLIEPIPLNEEQREAILKGLSSPLTVVTGPPGTGKSQVVASLIVNAVYQGQTVLFSSKNNKAVDVVNERVNGLSNRQVMLRLGARFQSTLSEYLSGLLSARPSSDDEARYLEAKSIHEQLLQQIEKIRINQSEVISLRNEIDQMEAGIETVRAELGPQLFAACEKFDLDKLKQSMKSVAAVKLNLTKADRSKQSFLTGLLWFIFKKERYSTARKYIDSIADHAARLGISDPQIPLDDSTIQLYRQYLHQVDDRNSSAIEVKEYFGGLDRLRTQEDLFQLSLKEKRAADEIVSNSIGLWDYWLQLLPNRMSQKDRKVIGDYVAVLNLIVAAESTNSPLDRGIWPKYYSFLPQITHILSCWAVTSLSARGRVPLEA
ncbi:MAG: AAA domain-containing protein [Cyclobacteriaceae bacterium]